MNIASDKFGTHVLCKGVAVKELEVGARLRSYCSSPRTPSRMRFLLKVSSTRSGQVPGGFGEKWVTLAEMKAINGGKQS